MLWKEEDYIEKYLLYQINAFLYHLATVQAYWNNSIYFIIHREKSSFFFLHILKAQTIQLKFIE